MEYLTDAECLTHPLNLGQGCHECPPACLNENETLPGSWKAEGVSREVKTAQI